MRSGITIGIALIVLGIVLSVVSLRNPSENMVFLICGGIMAASGAASIAFNRWIGKMFGGQGRPMSMGAAMEQAARTMTNAADMMEMQSRIARLRSEGDSALARIISARATGKVMSNDPMFDFELEVSVNRCIPYKVNHSQLVPVFLVSRLIPGAEFNAWVSRTKPNELALEWV